MVLGRNPELLDLLRMRTEGITEMTDKRVLLAKTRYRRLTNTPAGDLFALGDNDSVVIGRIAETDEYETDEYETPEYVGPHLRFFEDGRIETGILWGGDVWEPHGQITETVK